MKHHTLRNIKSSVPRNLTLSGLMLLALTGAAYAQAGNELKAKDAADAKAAKEYMDRMQTDEQYQKAIHEQASAPASNDPWGTVRPTTAPGNSAAKPAAKSATGAAKTASGAGKPAAAVKPAVSAGTPANGSAQTGQ
jgi:hypothetical protein